MEILWKILHMRKQCVPGHISQPGNEASTLRTHADISRALSNLCHPLLSTFKTHPYKCLLAVLYKVYGPWWAFDVRCCVVGACDTKLHVHVTPYYG